jgi:mRNA interferase RelE/StbE
MQVEISRKFGKQVEKCKDFKMRNKLFLVIKEISEASDLNSIKNLKKLKGHHSMYRIRLQDYRIGLVLQGNKVILAAFDHRSEMYKYFP